MSYLVARGIIFKENGYLINVYQLSNEDKVRIRIKKLNALPSAGSPAREGDMEERK